MRLLFLEWDIDKARRRIERRTQRLYWLRDLFAEEISKVDPAFFERLRESKFLEEDKKSSYPLGRYTLFADQNYCDKDYHQQFPTIYHLRKALIEESGSFDVRLVYLAIHHILKNREHFFVWRPPSGNHFTGAEIGSAGTSDRAGNEPESAYGRAGETETNPSGAGAGNLFAQANQ